MNTQERILALRKGLEQMDTIILSGQANNGKNYRIGKLLSRLQALAEGLDIQTSSPDPEYALTKCVGLRTKISDMGVDGIRVKLVLDMDKRYEAMDIGDVYAVSLYNSRVGEYTRLFTLSDIVDVSELPDDVVSLVFEGTIFNSEGLTFYARKIKAIYKLFKKDIKNIYVKFAKP